MDAVGDVTLYVERIAEPHTGLPLLGVGGYCPRAHTATRIDVRYDGETATVAVPTPSDEHRSYFSTQLPIEANVRRVQVAHCRPDGETILFDEPLDSVGQRAEPDATAEHGVKTKLLGVVGRGARSVLSGEVFSPRRWKARLDRFAEFLLRERQRVRYKFLARRFRPRSQHDAYVANTALSASRLAAFAEASRRFRYRPKVSILLPVYNVDPRWLRAAVDSVLAQVYDNWQLCLVDDASTNPALHRALDRLPRDPRIELDRRAINGHICAASNSAADLARGEFVALLDHDDALAPNALFEVVRLLQRHPDADLIYSDEDKIDAEGRRYDPQFKPDWSPELLLSYNYVNHFTCIRRNLFEAAGRFRVGYEGSQDHDLLLRATERTDRVHHIPSILYHWRSLPSSTASTAGVKTYVHTSGRKAVEDALRRRAVRATLSVPGFAKRLGLPVLQLECPDDGPPVAVIVYGPVEEATRTVRAVKANTAYRNVTPYLYLDPETPADALNRIAAARDEEVLVFVEAGHEPLDPAWLSRLLAYLRMPEVGAAGGVIRARDGTVVSAGTVVGMKDGIGPGNACLGVPAEGVSYYFYAEVARNVTAPGRGLLATRRDVFERAGGFDAERFPTTLFDVDYGMRLAGLGLRCVHVGGAELTRPGPAADRADDPRELLSFRRAYGRPTDPYYNPNLSDRNSFRQAPDAPAPLTPRSELRAVIAAHNLNSPEGAPRYLSEIVLGLRGRGALVPTVLSQLGGAGERVYREAGVPVTIADAPWSRRFVDGQWSPREYEAAQAYLRRFLKPRRPEVLVANTLLTFPVVEAAARLGVPSVWIIHESYSDEHLARLFAPFARARAEAAFALASRVVPASHDTAGLFAHLNTRGNFRVSHNGLDPAAFDAYFRRVGRGAAITQMPGPKGKKRVIAVGTVCERKGQHTLVEAAAELAKGRDDFVCYLVGIRDTVPYAGYVAQLVRRLGLEDVVYLVPETDNVWAFFRAADVFVCTSHMETFSRAIMEAEAFGLPIVSTPCCGVPEQVFWDYNALPFAVGDATGLAHQLGRVLEDDALRGRMALRSRAAFDAHLDYPEMLDRYEAVIRSAARAGRRGQGLPLAFDRADSSSGRRAA
jgi:glycosyltransferase involved in cell wall biosynthesis/GT2 family glycosyltransferase